MIPTIDKRPLQSMQTVFKEDLPFIITQIVEEEMSLSLTQNIFSCALCYNIAQRLLFSQEPRCLK
jgi:hypothetical protein